MSAIVNVVNGLASLSVVALVGRAVASLLQNPEERHRELVSGRERWATTVVGVPVLLVGLSAVRGGPFAVPFDPLRFTLLGVVLVVYPDFGPSSLG